MGARRHRRGEAGRAVTARRWIFAPEFLALLAAAFVLRLAIFYFVPNVHWPDEIYQVMEPAHRLAFGTGAVSWEWVAGIRSWLVPGLVAALMEVGRLRGDAPAQVNLPVEIFFAAAGCVPVAVGYFWSRKLYGRAGGFAAAAVAALWVDLLYISGHTLTEVLAADCLPLALYVGLPLGGEASSRRRLWVAGGLLGLTFAFRFHLAPALLVAAIGVCGMSRRRWGSVIASACIPILAMGLLDWVTLGIAFQSVTLNLWVNLAQGVSDEAGRLPFSTLFVLPFYLWGGAIVVIVLTALVGARRLPWLLAVVAAIFLVHSFIAHKEYRFIYPALPLIAILAGIGTAELIQIVREARPATFSVPWMPAALAAIFWGTMSLAIGLSPVYRSAWTRERAQLGAFDFAAHQADLCGVGLYGMRWAVTPGQSALPPRARLYQTDRAHLDRDAAAFNYIVAREQAPVPNARYHRMDCFAGDASDGDRWLIHACVWRRDGGCDASAGAELPVNWPRALTGNASEPPADPPWEDAPDER
jgi:GPI mannosyltransferase 3